MSEKAEGMTGQLKQWLDTKETPARIYVYLNEIEAALRGLDCRREREKSDYLAAYTRGFNDGSSWQCAKSAEAKQ